MFPIPPNHSLDLMKLFNPSAPEENVGGNQLRDGSVCLSPLSPKHIERFARQYRDSTMFFPDFALIKLRSFTIFQVLTRRKNTLYIEIYIYIYISSCTFTYIYK